MKEKYEFPKYDLLIKNDNDNETDNEYISEKEKIEQFFRSYNIAVKCIDFYSCGNMSTYIINLISRVKVSIIKSYKQDIMYAFNAVDVNVIIAINSSPYLGIQIIKNDDEIIRLGNLIDTENFRNTTARIPLILGKNFSNNVIIEDLAELPHLLISGTTGTGKSSLLSSFIIDIIYKFKPDEIKLLLVDTRKINFLRFNNIPHLLIPTITDANKAIGALEFLTYEMNNRYRAFEKLNVNNLISYNKISNEKLPQLVTIIEDFSDLMLTSNNKIEDSVIRLASMSRAAGIHIIISTQRPSVNVITGLIKANIPSRIAFKVPSQFDSKTIIDVGGAEDLQLYGDCLFRKNGECKISRIQVPFISDEEIKKVIDFLKLE